MQRSIGHLVQTVRRHWLGFFGPFAATTPTRYTGLRFPAEMIGYAIWLDFRFSLSYRDVEELLPNVAWW